MLLFSTLSWFRSPQPTTYILKRNRKASKIGMLLDIVQLFAVALFSCVYDWVLPYLRTTGNRKRRTNAGWHHMKRRATRWKGKSKETACARAMRRRDVLVCQFNQTSSRRRSLRFDSDSFEVLIDLGASYCTTNNLSDFSVAPKRVNFSVGGLTSSSSVTHIGTVVWKVHNNEGRRHTLRIVCACSMPGDR